MDEAESMALVERFIAAWQRLDVEELTGYFTDDALYHNIYSLETEKKDLTLILAGDHIYKMDYGQMIAAHQANQADLTVGCIPVPRALSKQFGVVTNIRKADVSEDSGWVELDIDGEPAEVERALDYCRSRGIGVQRLEAA